jgi:hypothetical protein
MGTNCASLLADLFVYSYESEFLQNLVKYKKIPEARAFNFTYKYIDDVLSINNPRFAEFVPLIYPPELEIKETTDTASSASFLDLYLEFDDSGQISTKIYDKRDDFILQDFEETPIHMSIQINRLEERHNSYPLVCRRPAETVPLRRRQICYR